jgi:hypothetical protein
MFCLNKLVCCVNAHMSLPDLTHSSVKQLLAVSLRCDWNIRCSALISGTDHIQKPDTFIQYQNSQHLNTLY